MTYTSGCKCPCSVGKLLRLEGVNLAVSQRSLAQGLKERSISTAALGEGPQGVRNFLRLRLIRARGQLLGKACKDSGIPAARRCKGPCDGGKALCLELTRLSVEQSCCQGLEELRRVQRDLGVRPDQVRQLEWLELIQACCGDLCNLRQELVVTHAQRRAGPSYDAHTLNWHLSRLFAMTRPGLQQAVLGNVLHDGIEELAENGVVLNLLDLLTTLRGRELDNPVERGCKVDAIHVCQGRLDHLP
mmetsp:Transcript_68851/g.125618  ORF Transcript_68851/g.125618 Transcript_68851/m.125618 type:complete len:245 (-) Transcript_68851:227-961(-)